MCIGWRRGQIQTLQAAEATPETTAEPLRGGGGGAGGGVRRGGSIGKKCAGACAAMGQFRVCAGRCQWRPC